MRRSWRTHEDLATAANSRLQDGGQCGVQGVQFGSSGVVLDFCVVSGDVSAEITNVQIQGVDEGDSLSAAASFNRSCSVPPSITSYPSSARMRSFKIGRAFDRIDQISHGAS